MYKVLFADDEPISLEGLRELVDWRGLGFEICGMCRDGEEALACIEAHRPDLVITDIRMPVLDGLGLLSRVRSEFTDDAPVFVMVSGYGDFDYARTALRFGVRHYLLKPVPEEEWEAVLKELMQELDARMRERCAKAYASRRLPPSMLLRLLYDEAKEPDSLELKRLQELDRGAGGWQLVLADGLNSGHPLVRELLEEERDSMAVDLQGGQLALLVKGSFGGKESADRLYGRLRDRGEEVRLAIGPWVPSLLQAGLSFMGAQESMVYHFFYPEAGPADYAEIRQIRVSYDTRVMDQTELIVQAAGRLQEEELQRLLRELFRQLRERMVAPEMARAVGLQLVLKGLTLLREAGCETDAGPRFWQWLQTGAKTLYQLEQTLQAYWMEVATQLKAKREERSNGPLSAVSGYIREHYRESLSVKEIGERFYLNPVYLGAVFMKRYGVSIIEYIHDLRIEEAKERLRLRDDTVRSIAEAVGYTYYHHFLKEFEKRVGEKPLEYRQRFRPAGH